MTQAPKTEKAPETAQAPKMTITGNDLVEAKGDPKFDGAKIIADTKRVIIEGKDAKVKKREGTLITVELPSDLREEPWTVILAGDEEEVMAILRYDPAKKQFVAADHKEDEDKKKSKTFSSGGSG